MNTTGQEVAKVTKATNMVVQIDQAIGRIMEKIEGSASVAQNILNMLSGYSIPCEMPSIKEDKEGLLHRFYHSTGRIEGILAHLEEVLAKIQEEITG